MKSSRKRTPLVLAGAAVAAALVALPATAAAEPVPVSYKAPTETDWADYPSLANPGDHESVKAHYNCRKGTLSVRVERPVAAVPYPGSVDEELPIVSELPPLDFTPGDQSSKVTLDGTPYTVASPAPATYDRPNTEPLPPTAPEGSNFGYYYVMSFPAQEGTYPLIAESAAWAGLPLPASPPQQPYTSSFPEVTLECPELAIEKTATGYYDKIHDWSVQNSVKKQKKQKKAGYVGAYYNIEWKKGPAQKIRHRFSGEITVTNPSDVEVPGVKIFERGVKNFSSNCVITGVTINGDEHEHEKGKHYVKLTLPPESTAVASYICHVSPKLPKKILKGTHENRAKVTWFKPPADGKKRASETARDPFEFNQKDQHFKKWVWLVNKKYAKDQNGKATKPIVHKFKVRKSGSWTYKRLLPAPKKVGCVNHVNTASLVDRTNKKWNPTSPTEVKICREAAQNGAPGAVTTQITNPTKPSTQPDKRNACYVDLRTSVNGGRYIAPAGRWHRLRIRNSGKHAADGVAARYAVPRGMRIVQVRRINKKKYTISRNKRTLYMKFDWVPNGRSVLAKVKPQNGARAKGGKTKLVAKHNCDNAKSQKKVVFNRR